MSELAAALGPRFDAYALVFLGALFKVVVITVQACCGTSTAALALHNAEQEQKVLACSDVRAESDWAGFLLGLLCAWPSCMGFGRSYSAFAWPI